MPVFAGSIPAQPLYYTIPNTVKSLGDTVVSYKIANLNLITPFLFPDKQY
jgi:hypothetical protein